MLRMSRSLGGGRSGSSILSSGTLREYGKQALGTVKMPSGPNVGFNTDLTDEPSTLAGTNTYDKAAAPKMAVNLKDKAWSR